MRPAVLLGCLVASALSVGPLSIGPIAPISVRADEPDFARDIYPIFEENCVKCHGPDRQKGKLRLDTREGITRSIRDELVIPGNAGGSELVHRISLPGDDPDVMPPEDEGGPLSEEQVALVEEWISEGARWSQPDGVPTPEEAAEAAESEAEQAGSDDVDFDRDVFPILEELSRQEREVILRWVDEGAPMPGDPETLFETPESRRLVNGLQVLYDFQSPDGEIVVDRVGGVDLTIEEMDQVRRTEGSLEILGDTLVRSQESPSRLIESIQFSGEITLEAWVRPANASQDGPARIVTLSQDSGRRNFTLGQDGDRYDVRFRTTSRSDNGLPSVSTPSGSLGTELTHVVYTRDRSGRTRLYLDGESVQEERVTGDLSNWDSSFQLALGNELSSGGRLWEGTYHLVAIYNRDLLPAEVEQHFRAGPNPEGLSSLSGEIAGGAGNHRFHAEVAPLLVEHCMECHDTATQEGGLDLSKQMTAFEGGESGEVIVAGDAEESLLWKLVKKDEMPDDRPALSDEEKEALRQWIDEGAAWPVEEIDVLAYSREHDMRENWLRRLTVSEYIETVRSTLGVEIEEEARRLLPRDLRADGFSNTAYNLNVDFEHVEAYRTLAEEIVGRMDVKAFASRFVDCERLTDDCMRELVAEMGKWVLRGPLEEHEVTVLRGVGSAVAAAGGGFEEAAAYILQAMVQSPRFVYRIENQNGDGTRWPVGDYELASRMSYIIWGGPPDEELMRAADEGELYDRSGVPEQIERMLQDPRAVQRSLEFVSQWLNLERLDNLRPSEEKFPEWHEELADDMGRETLAFFKDIVWGQERPLSDLLNAQVTYLTPPLAAHYGLEPKGEGMARYDVSSTPSRGGLLTQGSVLTVGGDEASTVTRGLFVLNDLLRGRVNDPPPCLDTSPVPTEPGVTKREIALDRIANPSCGGCHSKFEPLSFGLLKFDGLGSYQEEDEHGNRLRDDGEILFPGRAEPVEYDSSAELMDLLAQSERVEETLTWKLTQFAVGRPLGPTDVPVVEEIHESAHQDGGTYASLMTAIVTSDLVQKIQTESPYE